jgi:hypothetical protein
MAKDKTSFILYCDQQGLFNKLPDEIAGKLIKHIFAYVNDEDPITSDLLLEIAFEPIKLQLKRDLRKYDDYIDKQRLNGAKGGRPSKPTETQITQPFFQEPKKADNVNVTANANTNDNATNKKGFVKPTIEQLKEYMSEQGMNDIAENWLNHYEANGWMVGKVKMKDWKASVRTWKTNQKNNSATPQVVHKKVFNLSDYE